jgi:hypothetical protein
MPVAKKESFTFGGVDSRSNPANFPTDRALRCLNFSPQASGALRLRLGYTVPAGATADGLPIHSLVYYEQFSANFIGPQFCLYGKGSNVNLLNMATGVVNKASLDKKLAAPVGLSAADGGTGGTLAANTYYYVVTAIDNLGGETTISNEASVAIAANHQITLNWAAVAGAAGYKIYRGTSSGLEGLIATGPIATNSYSDLGATGGGVSIAITQITANGGGSNLATCQLASNSTGLFYVGQTVMITGNSNALFNTVASVYSITDASHLVLQASAFTQAGQSGGNTSQGPLSPGTETSNGIIVGAAWTISGGLASVTIGSGNTTQALLFTMGSNHFNLPSNATPLGVSVTVDRGSSSKNAVTDHAAQLYYNGGAVGSDKSSAGYWPFGGGNLSYGSSIDKWNWSGISVTALNDPTFGFFISGLNNGSGNATLKVYSVTITVYYSLPAQYGLTGTGGNLSYSSSAPPGFNSTQINLTVAMGSANPWGHFRANNKIFISSGGNWIGRFFSGDLQSWDGAQLRPVGLPPLSAFSNATGGPVAVSVVTGSGSFVPTTLTGYQLYGAIYNPNTGHLGNRFALGSRVTIGQTTSSLVLTGLPNQYFVGGFADPYPEWVLAIGMTNDGGQVPYWFVDASGNPQVIGNTATNATVSIGNINTLMELPARNDPPPRMDKFARVGTRIFGGLAGNPFLNYSNDQADISNANYIGNPEESWPPDQAEPLPDGNEPTAIHARSLEGWFFSRTNLAIWSQFLLQQGVNPWRGPWPGGCVGQRAFIETPYGPFWISENKELCTFMEDGVISASDEYEASLLGKIADQFLGLTELGYQADQIQLIDEIMIRGFDINGNPVVVVHDFKLKDQRSPEGQGYASQYNGLNILTFAGAGYSPRQNVFDTNGRQRLWVGSNQGFIAQLEDGLSDNGATYSADYIGLISLGTERPLISEIEMQGDSNVQFSFTTDYSQGLSGFTSVTQDLIPGETSRYGFSIGLEARWIYARFQLTSHPADGSFVLTDPPGVPMPVYGTIGEVTIKLGRPRPEGR